MPTAISSKLFSSSSSVSSSLSWEIILSRIKCLLACFSATSRYCVLSISLLNPASSRLVLFAEKDCSASAMIPLSSPSIIASGTSNSYFSKRFLKTCSESSCCILLVYPFSKFSRMEVLTSSRVSNFPRSFTRSSLISGRTSS